MLKKKALKRIFITTVAIFVVLIVYTLTNIGNDTIIYDDATYIKNSDMQTIYSLNNDNFISKTTVYVDDKLTLEEKVKSLLEVMIEKNNKNALLPSNFKPILPKNTEVLNVELDTDILKVDFSKELLNITKEQSEKMLEAIIYTLTEFDNVLGIEIYVDGKLLEYLPNTEKKLPSLLNKEFGINKVYNITSNNNINKVLLYYYTKDNNNLYHVPVTKYLNDSREKIEIIVEELSNSYIYEKNLISFLTNAELVNYEIKENVFTLVFNEEITKENEKGIEALLYSIFDNYDIDTIKIMAENTKFLEKNRKDIE